MIKTVTLYLSRIGCPSIPGTMKGVVMSIDGIKDVKVRYEERALDVTFDDEKVSVEKIIEKIGQELGLAMEETKDSSSKNGSAAETCPM